MDRRQVHHVEAERRDARQCALRVGEGAVQIVSVHGRSFVPHEEEIQVAVVGSDGVDAPGYRERVREIAQLTKSVWHGDHLCFTRVAGVYDKGGKREIFIAGVLAQNFRRDVNQLIANEPTMEEIDEFLGNYDSLMSQPVLLH